MSTLRTTVGASALAAGSIKITEADAKVSAAAAIAYLRIHSSQFRHFPAAGQPIVDERRLPCQRGLGARHASLMAPVARVCVISATSTIFVFLFGILLTVFFRKLGREALPARNVNQKAAGGVLIMAGVALMEAFGGG